MPANVVPSDSPAKRPISAGRASGIVISSIIAAASAFLSQVISARTLSVDDNQEFLLDWSLLFGVIGIVAGMQNETTRAVTAARSGQSRLAPGRLGPRVLSGGLFWAGLIAIGILASSVLWAPRLGPSTSPVIVIIAACAVVLYGCHATLAGALAGHREWGLFAWLMGGEAASRLFLAVLAGVFLAGSLLSMELAATASVLVWALFVLVSTPSRTAIGARADVPMRRLLSNCGLAIASSAASAALITGFPALLKLVSGHQDAAVMASLILAISLTRSPIMIPLQAFQGVAIAAFTESGASSPKALIKPMLLLLAIGAGGALLAWALGPWLMRLLFGDAYQLAGIVFAGLTIAAVSLAWLTLTGTAAIAASAHRSYTTGWVFAALVTLGLLFLPLGIEMRAVVALFFGPLSGAAIHLNAIARNANSRAFTER